MFQGIKMDYSKILKAAGGLVIGMAIASNALAVPRLQLFIEAADYETALENPADPETWAKLGTDSFRLWVLGDVDPTFRMRDVKFVASFADGLAPVLGFTPSKENNAHGFADFTTPVAVSGPFASQFDDFDNDAENWSNSGANDGPMGPHGMLTTGRTAVEWNLGMFDEYTTTKIADFASFSFPYNDTGAPHNDDKAEASDNWFPNPSNQKGQINVYDMEVSGLPVGAQVHFDVYGIVQERRCLASYHGNCTGYSDWADRNTDHDDDEDDDDHDFPPGDLSLAYVNAPFSHDARWEQIDEIPAPGAAVLMLGGLGGLGWMHAWRRKQAA